MTSLARWLETWGALGVEAAPGLQPGYEALIARYAEPQRHYHTRQHLEECFVQLGELRHLADHPGEVELALWFHDAIYDTRREDNEARSADWAHSSVLAAGVGREAANRVRSLVLSTRHAAEPAGIDAEVLVDIDLSILAAPPARFGEYERQVRQEYQWVPEFLFRRRRKEILEEFLARPRIFSTALFKQRHEAAARSNLECSIARLG